MGLEANQGALSLTRGSAPAIGPSLAAAISQAALGKALTRQSSEDRSRFQHTPRSQRPPPRLAEDFGKLGKATFPRESGPGRKGTELRKQGKRKRPGKGAGPKRLDGGVARPARRRNPQEKGKHKSPAANGGRPSKKRSPGPPSPTQDQDPRESHQQGPRPPAPAAGVPELDTLGAWRGGGELVAAERVFAFRWVSRLAGSCAFRARAGACEGLGKLAAGAPGWERHPERIRCRAREPTVRGRERTASSGSTAAPTESRGGPGAPESLLSFPLLKKGHQLQSRKKERSHHVFL